ncbi:group 1 truncated hemoglobin [Bdellovibrionota bacterium FG-1]
MAAKPSWIVTSDRPPLSRAQLTLLYSHIGGEAGLRAILRDFYQQLSKDILVGFFFDGKDLNQIADTQANFLMRAMGAIPSYSGKAPAQAHEHLAPILGGHFDRRLRVLEQLLRAHGLSDEAIQIWVQFENAFREAIVK